MSDEEIKILLLIRRLRWSTFLQYVNVARLGRVLRIIQKRFEKTLSFIYSRTTVLQDEKVVVEQNEEITQRLNS